MLNLHELYSKGIKEVLENDPVSQKNFRDIIVKNLRQLNPEIVRKAEGIFIPNDEYMVKYFGTEVLMDLAGCYRNGTCVWNNYLVFPIYNLADKIMGFVGFDPIVYTQTKETGEKKSNYYSYTTKDLFDKGKYLYQIKGGYKKAINDGYLCVVDGFFDCLSLEEAGFNSGALLGSTLTEAIVAQLRWVKNVILITDNDSAGLKLYHNCAKHLDNIIWVKQGRTKDVDALLKTEYREKMISTLKGVIENPFIKEVKVRL